MSEVLKRLAYLQTRRDRTPNLDLARDLVAQDDKAGIRKIAQNMHNENKNIHTDCVHVMYEIGIIEPKLIEPYSEDFIKLLKSKHSHMVSGAMTALAEIAKVNPEFIFKNLDAIKRATKEGDEVTVDAFISALANTASANEEYKTKILPHLIEHVSTCRPGDLPQHAESMLPAIDEINKDDFVKVLKKRQQKLDSAAFTRLGRVIRLVEKI